MRKVVGGPTAFGLGREPMDLSGQTGCSGGRRDDDGASLSLSKKRPCVRGRLGLRREPEDLSVQTEVTTAVCTHRRDGSTARGQTRRSSPREMLRPRHSTTAIPGTTLLLHPQLAEEAWGWSESSRHPGKSQVAHNLQVGAPGGGAISAMEVGGDCA